jgi:hypothetical protein
MKRKINFIAGFVLGAAIFGGATALAVNGVLATISNQPIYVNGKQIAITAYAIDGHNYVQLRDIAQAVDFGVEYDEATNSVQIDSTAHYAIPGAAVTPAPTLANGYPDKPQRNTAMTWTVNPWTRSNLSEKAIKIRDNFITSLDGLSDLEKLKKINAFIAAHLTYDLSAKGSGNDEEFWTTGSRGVCSNYANKVAYLCNLAEIPCVTIDGNTNASKTWDKPTHTWNEVYIDGKWEYFDATFSDGDGKTDRFIYGDAEREKRNATDSVPNVTLKSKETKLPNSTK